jgi:hypothetical protein
MAAAAEESTPPLIATAIFIVSYWDRGRPAREPGYQSTFSKA